MDKIILSQTPTGGGHVELTEIGRLTLSYDYFRTLHHLDLIY